MKEIKLTNSDLVALIDDEDHEKITKFNWYLWSPYKNKNYALTGKAGFRMHHLVLGIINTSKDIHHKNENGLDNQKLNLSSLTRSEHLATRPKQKNNNAGFKGVYLKKGQGNRRDSYVAQIGKRGEPNCHIGCFITPEEAARAYDVKAKERFGEHATLNFS